VNQASGPALHIDLVLLQGGVDRDEMERLNEEAASLEDLAGVQRVGLITSEAGEGSDFDLAYLFVVESAAALEDFGTDGRYVRFLQGGLARAMQSFGGADVQLMGAFERSGAYAACLALMGTPQTYDWQVRDALAAWGAGTAVGLAIGERQRYRGVGVMFSNQPIARPESGFEGFGLDFICGPYQLLA
jgi:hypothetical protein